MGGREKCGPGNEQGAVVVKAEAGFQNEALTCRCGSSAQQVPDMTDLDRQMGFAGELHDSQGCVPARWEG